MTRMAETTLAQRAALPFDGNAQTSVNLLIESAPIAITMVDQQGQIIYVNTKLEELFGYARAELLGAPIETLMPTRFHAIHLHHRAHYMQHPHVRAMGSGLDLAGRRKDGSEFPIEAGLSHLTIGAETLVTVTITDISKRKEIESQLERRVTERTYEIERRRQVADGLRGSLAILNANRSLAEILNYIAEQGQQLLGADAVILFSQDERQHAEIQASIGIQEDRWQQGGVDKILLPTQALLADGAISSHHASERDGTTADATPGSEPVAGDGYHTRLTAPIEIKRVIYGGLMLCYREPRHFSEEEVALLQTMADQTALVIENARLRTQIERSAVTAERNRLARELHDAVTQTLFAISIIAEVLPKLWERKPEEGRRRLDELRDLTRGALAEMRTLLLELRPGKLVDVRLAELLRQLTAALSARARLDVTLEILGDDELAPDTKIAFYRVAQEALNNVSKHARARHVQITLRQTVEVASLRIQDDGCGFVFSTIAPEHLGLGIMRERAEDIGAILHVHSAPNQGTTISLQWSPNSRQ